MNLTIPFYSNTPDGTHCFQAALKMVAKYFWLQEECTWDELDTITAKTENRWTWPMAGILWLAKRGVETRIIDPFDYNTFSIRKESYLLDIYGKDVGTMQIKNSNILREVKLAAELVKKVRIEKRIPHLSDITQLLHKDYVLICNVNSQCINNKEGYTGHFVVVKGHDDTGLYFHDPGLPPFENRQVPFPVFEKAWAYPNDYAKNIIAARLP